MQQLLGYPFDFHNGRQSVDKNSLSNGEILMDFTAVAHKERAGRNIRTFEGRSAKSDIERTT